MGVTQKTWGRWSDNDKAVLRQLYAMGKTHQEMADLLNRTERAVETMCHKLRLVKESGWSAPDEEKAEQMYMEFRTNAHIAKAFGKTLDQVRSLVTRRGLVQKRKALKLSLDRTKTVSKFNTGWTEEEDAALACFFEGGTRAYYIAYRLNRTEKAVVSRAYKMGLMRRYEEASC